MKVSDFDFTLPPGLIADRPLPEREAARLLVVRPGRLEDRHIGDLPGELQPGDLLVVNDTRVIRARLTGLRGIAKIELTLHMQEGLSGWRAFARPAKKLKAGDRIVFAPDFSAEVAAKGEGGEITLAFDRSGGELLAAIEQYGSVPLPPYIKRSPDEQDRADYQTIFARAPGAVAAPTAGLHFTPALMERLAARGIGREMVTLHVGAGTFLPVKVDDTQAHHMHEEWGELTQASADHINEARAAGGRIVAVGTTALRLLESAAGEDGMLRPFLGPTRLFITPGYRFRAVDRMVTNFHLPKSTLFMLVAAFAGLERMKSAYAHAMESGYRFYSYGDATLLHPAGDAS